MGPKQRRGFTFGEISAAAAKEVIATSPMTILDVRTAQEFGQGHIKGAKHFPLGDINSRISEIAALKDQPLLVYCLSGHRSASACQILRKNGFIRIRNLRGGITAWNNSGNQIVKEN